jgi:hypothetical protein
VGPRRTTEEGGHLCVFVCVWGNIVCANEVGLGPVARGCVGCV